MMPSVAHPKAIGALSGLLPAGVGEFEPDEFAPPIGGNSMVLFMNHEINL
jgi:hypothetical protein